MARKSWKSWKAGVAKAHGGEAWLSPECERKMLEQAFVRLGGLNGSGPYCDWVYEVAPRQDAKFALRALTVANDMLRAERDRLVETNVERDLADHPGGKSLNRFLYGWSV